MGAGGPAPSPLRGGGRASAAYDLRVPTKIQRTRALLNRVGLESANPSDFRERADEVLGDAVGYDASSWDTVDPPTMLPTSCIVGGAATRDHDRARRLFQLEAEGDDLLMYRDLARQELAGALGLATGGHPEASRRFRELLAPLGAIDELRAALVAGGECWGTMAAFRGSGREPYTASDVALVRAVAPVLGAGLRLSLLNLVAQAGAGSGAPGWLLLDTDDRLIGSTPAGERWLDELAPEGQLPTVVHSLAAAVRRGASQPHVDVPARSGGWLTLHGSMAQGLDGARVALIIEPMHRPGIAPELCAAYSLTPREQDVLGAVMRGHSTKQIAADLGISGWTVRDHIRALFAKTGVQNRTELAACIFDRHVWQRFREGACPGPNGWFLDSLLPQTRDDVARPDVAALPKPLDEAGPGIANRTA